MSSRWPPGRDLDQVGQPPDYRFTLANERTYLAWIRTSLGLAAAGLAVDQFVVWPGYAGARVGLSVTLLLLALACGATAWRRWHARERAMRLGEELPRASLTWVLSVGVSVVVAGAVVGVLVTALRGG